jgi:Domain of unknown function (DUF4262)
MMNPPRSRRAPMSLRERRRESGVSMHEVAEEVSTVGWAVQAASGNDVTAPWAYTVGLWASHQAPELVISGLPTGRMLAILHAVAERISNGTLMTVANAIAGICPSPLTVRPVHASWRETSVFGVSDNYYGYVRPRYLQVVWPDQHRRYPGQLGFSGRQPMLWLPVEDHPAGTWARLDQAC